MALEVFPRLSKRGTRNHLGLPSFPNGENGKTSHCGNQSEKPLPAQVIPRQRARAAKQPSQGQSLRGIGDCCSMQRCPTRGKARTIRYPVPIIRECSSFCLSEWSGHRLVYAIAGTLPSELAGEMRTRRSAGWPLVTSKTSKRATQSFTTSNGRRARAPAVVDLGSQQPPASLPRSVLPANEASRRRESSKADYCSHQRLRL